VLFWLSVLFTHLHVLERTRQEQGLLAELRANRPDCTASEAADVVQSRLGAPSFDLDFAIVALDLCGSVCEALGAQSKSALSQVPLADLLQEGVLCGDSSVKQAAFGLVGDLARHCWELLPGPQVFQLLFFFLFVLLFAWFSCWVLLWILCMGQT
jgi:hypothetical protein